VQDGGRHKEESANRILGRLLWGLAADGDEHDRMSKQRNVAIQRQTMSTGRSFQVEPRQTEISETEFVEKDDGKYSRIFLNAENAVGRDNRLVDEGEMTVDERKEAEKKFDKPEV
jgi:hypothetical protein